MARPKKDNADYFSHDNDMRNDPKIKYIRSLFWATWYAVYNMILEYLTGCQLFQANRSEQEVKLLCWDFMIPKEDFTKIVHEMISINLLKLEDWKLSSEWLNKRLQPVLDKRENMKKLAEKRWDNWCSNDATGIVSATEGIQSKVKERKEKKSIEDNISLKKDLVYYSFVKEFINLENPQIKYQTEKQGEEKYFQKQFAEIDKLEKDWFSLEAIKMVLAFVRQDSFRQKNILSIKKLREKDKNGVPYIVRMVDEIQKRKPQNKISSLPWIN